MYRFLFCPWPTLGECYPLLEVAIELRKRGHDVRFYCHTCLLDLFYRLHFDCYEMPDTALIGPLRSSKGPTATYRHLLSTLPLQLSYLDRAIADFKPDVLVDGMMLFAPRLLGEALGIPQATIYPIACSLPSVDLFPYGLGLSPPMDPWMRSLARVLSKQHNGLLAEEISIWNSIRVSLGLPPQGEHPWFSVPSRHLIIITTTPEFEYKRSDLPQYAHFVGPLLWRHGEEHELPSALSSLDGSRPVIYISQGTFFTQDFPILRLAATAMALDPVTMVFCTGRQVSASELGTIPPNALVYSYLPQETLLPKVDLIITHGGAGTVNEGLSQGLPFVILPMGADQPETAQRCVQAGVGLSLDLKHCTPEMLHHAVWEVLRNPWYRENARRIQDSYRTFTGPKTASDLLTCLAITKKPVEYTKETRMQVDG